MLYQPVDLLTLFEGDTGLNKVSSPHVNFNGVGGGCGAVLDATSGEASERTASIAIKSSHFLCITKCPFSRCHARRYLICKAAGTVVNWRLILLDCSLLKTIAKDVLSCKSAKDI
jgi:hypothetical protein